MSHETQIEQYLAGPGLLRRAIAGLARMPDYDLWMAFFRDLDGNTFAIMAEHGKS